MPNYQKSRMRKAEHFINVLAPGVKLLERGDTNSALDITDLSSSDRNRFLAWLATAGINNKIIQEEQATVSVLAEGQSHHQQYPTMTTVVKKTSIIMITAEDLFKLKNLDTDFQAFKRDLSVGLR